MQYIPPQRFEQIAQALQGLLASSKELKKLFEAASSSSSKKRKRGNKETEQERRARLRGQFDKLKVVLEGAASAPVREKLLALCGDLLRMVSGAGETASDGAAFCLVVYPQPENGGPRPRHRFELLRKLGERVDLDKALMVATIVLFNYPVAKKPWCRKGSRSTLCPTMANVVAARLRLGELMADSYGVPVYFPFVDPAPIVKGSTYLVGIKNASELKGIWRRCYKTALNGVAGAAAAAAESGCVVQTGVESALVGHYQRDVLKQREGLLQGFEGLQVPILGQVRGGQPKDFPHLFSAKALDHVYQYHMHHPSAQITGVDRLINRAALLRVHLRALEALPENVEPELLDFLCMDRLAAVGEAVAVLERQFERVYMDLLEWLRQDRRRVVLMLAGLPEAVADLLRVVLVADASAVGIARCLVNEVLDGPDPGAPFGYPGAKTRRTWAQWLVHATAKGVIRGGMTHSQARNAVAQLLVSQCGGACGSWSWS